MKISSEGAAAPAPASDAVLTVPNVVSALRLSSVPVFLWLFARGREEWGVVVYAVGAGTDFVDGYIARRTGSVSELGKLLDPLADRVFVFALAFVLLVRGALPGWLALVVVGRDAVLLAAWPVLERRGVPRISVSRTGKAATAALLFGLTWLALGETDLALGRWGGRIGTLSVSLGAALYWVAAAGYARRAAAGLRVARARGPRG
jgi:cardiolipin synthase